MQTPSQAQETPEVSRIVLTQRALFATIEAHLANRKVLSGLIRDAESLQTYGTLHFHCGRRTGTIASTSGLDCYSFHWGSGEFYDGTPEIVTPDNVGVLNDPPGFVRHPNWTWLSAGPYLGPGYLDAFDARTKVLEHQYVVLERKLPGMDELHRELAHLFWNAGRADVVFIIT
ncbi:hypothetical protein D3C87_857480 [compost metagenome]